MAIFAKGIAAAVIVAALLAGCATTAPAPADWKRVDPGSTVEVKREFAVPAGARRVYLQDGVALEDGRPARRGTYCDLRLRERQPTTTRIMPGRFAIESLRQSSPGDRFPGPPLASGEKLLDRSMNVVSSIEMRLRSPEQPEVLALTCSKYSGSYIGFDPRGYYPGLAEISAALGDLVTITPP